MGLVFLTILIAPLPLMLSIACKGLFATCQPVRLSSSRASNLSSPAVFRARDAASRFQERTNV
ncbi:hypothetical protein SAMN05519103_08753 [Rhizobiales bacterium GAS113]|nr:hypothetical protein SAMN05519103_08753 [Rhizobiales bacterium GAS113]